MLLRECYEKIDEWANSTAATRLLKMATNAGVKFSGEELTDICLVCEEPEWERAIHFSSDRFTDADLEVLYGCADDDLLIDTAEKIKEHFRLRSTSV